MASSRKVGMSKWKQGQRRSPRLSVVLDARQSRSVCRTALVPHPGPASRTKASASARKTRKLTPLQHVASTSLSPFSYQTNDVQRSNLQSHDDHPISSDQPTSQGDSSPKLYDDKATSPGTLIRDQPSSMPSTEWMPEKRILELILDILQRRDTYEIFAEPVNPEEVEDYYEIIKEPMDFGTMRAKLHEGMYTSLQQFEHDVYLIPGNAMHFNSPTTIYFRQARAIYELAKKVFSSLKTDRENFEFSETKRRTSRRLMCEARAPSSSKLATNMRPNIKTNLSSKCMPCFLRNSSNLSKSTREICQHSDAATGFDARDYAIRSSAINCRRNSYAEVDRRCTYTPWTSLLTENASTVYSDSKPLIPVNQQDIGYRDSLMLFVKDLGATAQMIAKRKLIGCSVDVSKHLFWQPECQNPILDCALTRESVNIFDQLYSHRGPKISGNTNYNVDAGEKAYASGQMLMSSVEVASSIDERKIAVAVKGDDQSGNGARELKLSVGESSTPIVMVESNYYGQLESSLAPQSQENMLDFRWRKEEVEARPGFIFDLPFLKKRLDEINSLGNN